MALDWLIENVSMSGDNLIVDTENGTFQLQPSESKAPSNKSFTKDKIASVLFAHDVNLSSNSKVS